MADALGVVAVVNPVAGLVALNDEHVVLLAVLVLCDRYVHLYVYGIAYVYGELRLVACVSRVGALVLVVLHVEVNLHLRCAGDGLDFWYRCWVSLFVLLTLVFTGSDNLDDIVVIDAVAFHLLAAVLLGGVVEAEVEVLLTVVGDVVVLVFVVLLVVLVAIAVVVRRCVVLQVPTVDERTFAIIGIVVLDVIRAEPYLVHMLGTLHFMFRIVVVCSGVLRIRAADILYIIRVDVDVSPALVWIRFQILHYGVVLVCRNVFIAVSLFRMFVPILVVIAGLVNLI